MQSYFRLARLLALALALARAAAAGGHLKHLTVKVLAQKRSIPLARLLASLEAAAYPPTATVDVEVHVDALAPTSFWNRRSQDEADRKATVKAAESFAARWTRGSASVKKAKDWKGIRRAWLDAVDPSVLGDEGSRVLVVEDDLELSPAWFEFLDAATAAYGGRAGVAGVSLQRQASRLDAYATELGDRKAKATALAPMRLPEGDGVYLFPHVGPWGFSPEPKVWQAFLEWFGGLRRVDADQHYSFGADGTPYGARADVPVYRESVVSRWYRRLVQNTRGDAFGGARPDSMWTAHFDAFCAARGLATLHARVAGNSVALATSHRADGAHYSGVNRADARLVALEDYRARAPALFGAAAYLPERLDLAGRPAGAAAGLAALERFGAHFGKSASPGWRGRFQRALAADGGRRLFEAGEDLDLLWTTAGGWGAADASVKTEELLSGLHHGYAPLADVTRERALCVLEGKRVAILGDSITRYFAYTLNYFLKFGEVPPEYDSGMKWGDPQTKNPWTGSDFYDLGQTWPGSTDRSPDDKTHKQWIQAAFEEGVETSFWFIQDTWYPALEALAEDTLRSWADVLVFNSGWWEVQKQSDDDGTDCEFEKMYQDPSCLTKYAAELGELYDGLLRYFQGSGKAVMFRASNCCGGTSTKEDKRRTGGIAVAAMNTVVTQELSPRGVEIMDVEDTANPANVGNGGDGDPDGRTFDGGHPRAAVQYAWVQLFLNKAARQLGREACFETAPPSPRPTPRPTAEAGSPCANGLRDPGETDVDCGGPDCGPCEAGRACASADDCETPLCFEGVCVLAPTPAPSAAEPEGPAPRPTFMPVFAPSNDDPGGDDDGGGYDGPPARDLGSCGGGNDGVVYKRDGGPLSEVLGVCPAAGQRVLLAAAVGVLLATAVAWLAVRARGGHRAYRNAAQKRPPSEEAKEDKAPRKKEDIEAELSGAALHVLKQMEKREGGRDRDHRPTMDKITEDQPVSGEYRLSTSRLSRPKVHARTADSRFSQHFSVAGTHAQRTSRYSEYRSSAGGRASSVAFSLYDGGDSDDSEAEEEEAAAEAPPGAPPPPAPAAGRKTLAACLAACQLGLVLALACIGDSRMPAGFIPAGTVTRAENMDLWTFLMLSLVFCSLWCLKKVKTEDPTSSCFLSRAQANEWKGWMQVAFVAYHYTNAQDVYVPIRWLVSAYVWLTGFGNGVYFWASADFSAKRFLQQLWRMNFLCALLAMATNTAWIDYYFVALATVHFVLIFLCLGAARLLGKFIFKNWPTPDRRGGVEACDAEKAVGWVLLVVLTCVLWVPPQLPGNGGVDGTRNGAPKTPYDYVFQIWLKDINKHTADYFWQRTRMDYLSSIHGLAFAAVYARFRDAWPKMACGTRSILYVVAGGALAAAIAVAKMPQYCCEGGAEYRKVNAYVGTLWIPAYLLVRNSTPFLMNRVSAPMEWIGMHSLEFYLLQFHVFMTRKSQYVLYVIPSEAWGYTNMAIVGFLFVLIVVKSLELTNVVRSVVWRATRLKVGLGALWFVAAYTLYEAYFKHTSQPCSPLSWGVWAAFAAVASAALVFWTITDLVKK